MGFSVITRGGPPAIVGADEVCGLSEPVGIAISEMQRCSFTGEPESDRPTDARAASRHQRHPSSQKVGAEDTGGGLAHARGPLATRAVNASRRV